MFLNLVTNPMIEKNKILKKNFKFFLITISIMTFLVYKCFYPKI